MIERKFLTAIGAPSAITPPRSLPLHRMFVIWMSPDRVTTEDRTGIRGGETNRKNPVIFRSFYRPSFPDCPYS